jgi:hypothetical protein
MFHLHNLSDDLIAVDLNPAHMRPESSAENNGRRKSHQNKTTARDHDYEDRCRFGEVYYLNDPQPTSQTHMLFGKYVWLLQRIHHLQQESGIRISPKIFNQGTFHQISIHSATDRSDSLNLFVDEAVQPPQAPSPAPPEYTPTAPQPPQPVLETHPSPYISPYSAPFMISNSRPDLHMRRCRSHSATSMDVVRLLRRSWFLAMHRTSYYLTHHTSTRSSSIVYHEIRRQNHDI